MDGMTWIHANSNLREIRQLDLIISADMQVDVAPDAKLIDNTWSMTLPERVWAESPITKGQYVYAPGTEWGGPVTLVRHVTDAHQIILQGPTWRGLLHQKIIYPPAGQGYLVLEDVDANAAISLAAGDQLGSLFRVESEPAGVSISASYRYQSLAAGLQSVFREKGLRLSIAFDPSIPAAVVSAVPVSDLSQQVEISQDYGVDFSSEIGNVEEANHCLALGRGELAARQVAHVYRIGNTYYLERPSSLTDADLRTVKLDYPNAEDEDELVAAAVDKLRERSSRQQISVDELAIDLSIELGDLVSVRDRVTGLAAKTEAQTKILNIAGGRTAVSLTVAALMGAGSSVVLQYWQDLNTVTWDEVAAFTWGSFIEA